MDAGFWHERWSRGEIGFHQHDYNAHMQAFFHRLGVPANGHVLVPLCGKSLDLLWLERAGYHVTGIELSRRAIEDFFSENRLTAKQEKRGSATWFTHGRLRIAHADFFDTPALQLGAVDGVYDRASLVALPAEMRPGYAEVLLGLLPVGARSLLITLDYPQEEMKGPPFSVGRSEVDALYGATCDIEEIHSEDCLQREPRFRKKGLSRLHEHVFLMRKRAVAAS